MSIGTAIINIARLIYQRWKKEFHPVKYVKAVADPTPAIQDSMTPNFANPIVCRMNPTPTNDAKKSSEKTIGCQISIVKINIKSWIID